MKCHVGRHPSPQHSAGARKISESEGLPAGVDIAPPGFVRNVRILALAARRSLIM